MKASTVSVRAAVAATLLGSALAAAPVAAAAAQESSAMNPQPEVPSKPSAAGGRSVKSPLKVAPRPSDKANPKAMNPQPEVPSKPHKKLRKKKPSEAA